ncbi:MAG: acetyl-CoA carboxylase biotin carboxyl carrier protein [Vallitaleaceae bacterium]|nr:acetyl-CoA carboxylase biotin carboxyl carrier protein [Vallitaleaceae bacterium]
METKEIKELIELLQGTDYRYIVIKNEGTSILLSKDKTNEISEPVVVAAPVLATPATPVNVVASIETSKEVVKEQTVEKTTEQVQVALNDADCFVIKSPIVGTYYSASSPDNPPFVKKGDKVKKGDVLCIIEAMKLMNDIDSDVDGEIVEVFLSNEAVVEYGQPLFKVKIK